VVRVRRERRSAIPDYVPVGACKKEGKGEPGRFLITEERGMRGSKPWEKGGGER